MDTLLKIVQIGFYITAASIGILTYLKAKNGLLNTVNTEYQKKVIDRLAELSTELLDEFDSSSDNHWSREGSVKEVLDRIHEEVIPYKNEIVSGYRIWDALVFSSSTEILAKNIISSHKLKQKKRPSRAFFI